MDFFNNTLAPTTADTRTELDSQAQREQARLISSAILAGLPAASWPKIRNQGGIYSNPSVLLLAYYSLESGIQSTSLAISFVIAHDSGGHELVISYKLPKVPLFQLLRFPSDMYCHSRG